MKNHKIRNKAIGQGSCVKVQHDPNRTSEPYSYSRKNNTDTRLICRTCMAPRSFGREFALLYVHGKLGRSARPTRNKQ